MEPDKEYTLVKDAYDLHRTARYNVKLYGVELAKLRRWSIIIDVATAIGASSTLASISLMNTQYGKVVIGVLAAIAAICAAIKPVLNYPGRIESTSKHWAQYNELFNSLHRMILQIARRGGWDESCMTRDLDEALDKVASLSKDDIPHVPRKTETKLQDQVNEELPISTYWWPASAA